LGGGGPAVATGCGRGGGTPLAAGGGGHPVGRIGDGEWCFSTELVAEPAQTRWWSVVADSAARVAGAEEDGGAGDRTPFARVAAVAPVAGAEAKKMIVAVGRLVRGPAGRRSDFRSYRLRRYLNAAVLSAHPPACPPAPDGRKRRDRGFAHPCCAEKTSPDRRQTNRKPPREQTTSACPFVVSSANGRAMPCGFVLSRYMHGTPNQVISFVYLWEKRKETKTF
jgi:hypothetical protein